METELDYLLLVNNEIFLIETKPGEVHKKDIERFKKISKILRLGNKMILLLAESEEQDFYSCLHGAFVIPTDRLEQHFVNEFTNIAKRSL